MSETRERTSEEHVVECDGCGRRLQLGSAGLVEDGAVLCSGCAPAEVAADLDLATAA